MHSVTEWKECLLKNSKAFGVDFLNIGVSLLQKLLLQHLITVIRLVSKMLTLECLRFGSTLPVLVMCPFL